VSQDDKVWWYL